jgi:Uma2 family endonuclease
MLLDLKQIDLYPGQKIIIKDIDWLKFEQILTELGETRNARVAYNNHTLEIMTPLPEHESNKEIISDLIKALLEELEIEFYPLGSTTFKNQIMEYGIEPDNCFYIENEAQIRGKTRLDLTQDPPPDLALEIDVTSRTHTEIYQKLGVKELWCFSQGKLKIMVLETAGYQEVKFSPHFPNLPLTEIIPEYLERVKQEGRNKTLKAFRNSVKGLIYL